MCAEMSVSCLSLEKPVEDAISRIRFAPQSNNLLISSWDSSLRLYDVDSSVLRLESPSEAALLDCCFQNETTALSAGSDGSIRRYDLHAGVCDTIGNHDDIATCVGYSGETCQVVTASLDKKIKLWDTRQAESLVSIRNMDAEVGTMALSGFQLVVAIGASVYTHDLRNLECNIESRESPVDIRCVSSNPYSSGYTIGSVDGRVALNMSYRSNSEKIRYTFRCHPKSMEGRFHLASVNGIEFHPHVSGAFATGDSEGYAMVWDAQSRRKLLELPKFPNSVASLSYNHDGQILAVASSHTYQEAIEREETPQIFIHTVDQSVFGGSSNETTVPPGTNVD